MDEMDVDILKELQRDARMVLRDVSRKIGLSVSAISDRIHKMEQEQVITKYTAILDPKKFGKNLTCFCFLILQSKTPQGVEEFFAFVRNEEDILDCYCITGQYEYMLKICTCSTATLEALIARMRNNTAVKNTNSFIVLSTAKESPSVIPTDGRGQN